MIADHPHRTTQKGGSSSHGGLAEDADAVPAGSALAEGVDRVGARVDDGSEPVEDLPQAVGLEAADEHAALDTIPPLLQGGGDPGAARVRRIAALPSGRSSQS
jgi:hypothetical protein